MNKTTLEIIPSGFALGAEIRGADLSGPLDVETRQTIIDAFLEHQAIYFRRQDLNDEQLVAFSTIFGELMADHRPKDYYPELDTNMPDLVDVVSNVVIDGKPIGALGAGEVIWHSDTVPLPNSALFLHALEIPQTGVNTRLASTRAAYEALPEDLRERVHQRILIHGRQDYKLVKEDGACEIDPSLSPGPWFPLVRTHGDTGRKNLFLGRQGDRATATLSICRWTRATRYWRPYGST